MVRIAREFGREPAMVADAKKIWGLARQEGWWSLWVANNVSVSVE